MKSKKTTKAQQKPKPKPPAASKKPSPPKDSPKKRKTPETKVIEADGSKQIRIENTHDGIQQVTIVNVGGGGGKSSGPSAPHMPSMTEKVQKANSEYHSLLKNECYKNIETKYKHIPKKLKEKHDKESMGKLLDWLHDAIDHIHMANPDCAPKAPSKPISGRIPSGKGGKGGGSGKGGGGLGVNAVRSGPFGFVGRGFSRSAPFLNPEARMAQAYMNRFGVAERQKQELDLKLNEVVRAISFGSPLTAEQTDYAMRYIRATAPSLDNADTRRWLTSGNRPDTLNQTYIAAIRGSRTDLVNNKETVAAAADFGRLQAANAELMRLNQKEKQPGGLSSTEVARRTQLQKQVMEIGARMTQKGVDNNDETILDGIITQTLDIMWESAQGLATTNMQMAAVAGLITAFRSIWLAARSRGISAYDAINRLQGFVDTMTSYIPGVPDFLTGWARSLRDIGKTLLNMKTAETDASQRPQSKAINLSMNYRFKQAMESRKLHRDFTPVPMDEATGKPRYDIDPTGQSTPASTSAPTSAPTDTSITQDATEYIEKYKVIAEAGLMGADKLYKEHDVLFTNLSGKIEASNDSEDLIEARVILTQPNLPTQSYPSISQSRLTLIHRIDQQNKLVKKQSEQPSALQRVDLNNQGPLGEDIEIMNNAPMIPTGDSDPPEGFSLQQAMGRINRLNDAQIGGDGIRLIQERLDALDARLTTSGPEKARAEVVRYFLQARMKQLEEAGVLTGRQLLNARVESQEAEQERRQAEFNEYKRIIEENRQLILIRIREQAYKPAQEMFGKLPGSIGELPQTILAAGQPVSEQGATNTRQLAAYIDSEADNMNRFGSEYDRKVLEELLRRSSAMAVNMGNIGARDQIKPPPGPSKLQQLGGAITGVSGGFLGN